MTTSIPIVSIRHSAIGLENGMLTAIVRMAVEWNGQCHGVRRYRASGKSDVGTVVGGSRYCRLWLRGPTEGRVRGRRRRWSYGRCA